MTFGEPVAPCGDCVDGHCTMNCSTPMKPGSIFPVRPDIDWRPIDIIPPELKQRKLEPAEGTLVGWVPVFGLVTMRWHDDAYKRHPKPVWYYDCPNGWLVVRRNQPTHWAIIKGPQP